MERSRKPPPDDFPAIGGRGRIDGKVNMRLITQRIEVSLLALGMALPRCRWYPFGKEVCTMKKKITAILLTIALLAGCEAAPVPAQENTLNIDAIVQQSAAGAIAQYEKSQREKDTEIAMLKAQLEELTSQTEETSDSAEPPEVAPSEDPAPTSSQPEEQEVQPETEPEEPTPTQSSESSSRYDGFDLRNMYPAFIWENFQPIEGDQGSNDVWVLDYEYEEEPQNTSGFLREDDAWMVTQFINQEREAHGLETLPVDDDLMELAAIRAVELWEGEYSHTRPDGTKVSEQRCGENIGRRNSAQAQVTSWMNSEGHRKNNLSERYHHIGAGCYQAPNDNLYWVAVFSLD